jgi:hypothetical protein
MGIKPNSFSVDQLNPRDSPRITCQWPVTPINRLELTEKVATEFAKQKVVELA